jgi:4-amino-4-deoxy-L-arabinose transferase-like glycosyltransferase
MPYDQVVWVLRLLSIILVTPLPLLIWAAARRLAEPSTAVAAAAMSVGIPGLTRVGANVQNDDLLILVTSAMLVGLVRVVTGDLSRRTAVFVGLFTALALFTKGFALVLPVVVVAAYAVHRRAGVKPGLWALGVGGLLGGPWYLMNLIRFGKLQPEGLGAKANLQFFGTADGKPHPLSGYVHQASNSLVRRFWGAIGIPDSPSLPLGLAWTLTIAITVLIVVAVARSRGRRQQLGVLLLPIPLMLVIVVVGSHHWWAINGKLPGVQGRYLYPGLLGLLIVVAMGLTSLLRSRRNLAPLVAIGVALLLQAWALAIMLHTFWVPGRDVAAGVRGILHWSPWPPAVTVVPFVALVVLAPWALLLCARGAFTRSGPVIDGEPAPSRAAIT